MKMMNKLKNIQLIALDIDGTSMNSNSEITEYTRNVIQRLANKYVVVPFGISLEAVSKEAP